MKIEFLENKKLQYQYIFAMLGIVAIMFIYFKTHEYFLNKNPAFVISTVSEREIDRKNNVTIIVFFEINGQRFRSIDVVTGIEYNNKIKINIGDTVKIKYYKLDPSINKIILLNKEKYTREPYESYP